MDFLTGRIKLLSTRQMEFNARRKENLQYKNQLKHSIINEPKISVFKISQGNLRINPFHFYIPINEARGKYLISCLFSPHKFQLF